MLNRKLRWALGATLVLTAGALLMPEGGDSPRIAADLPSGRVVPNAAAPEALGTALPTEIERQAFSVPERDLFAAVLTPPPTPVAPAVAAGPVGPPLPPPPPPPPPFRAAYAAQLMTPTGERVLYLRDGEQLVAAQVGTVLSGGYVIDAIVRAGDKGAAGSASSPARATDVVAVEVSHAPSNSRHVIEIPEFSRPPSQ